jgi:uncharacterized protein
MLLDEIKSRMFKAMKEGRVIEKEILRVAVGEITTQAARENASGSDEEAQAIVRKLVKSNEESLAFCEDASRKAALQLEIQTLLALLPKSLELSEIIDHLGPVRDGILSASNAGQATGVAMKHLKAEGATVSGKDVALAVARIRDSARGLVT